MRNRVLQAMLVGLAGLAISTPAQAEFGDELFTVAPLLMDSDERIPTPGMEFGGAAAVEGDYALVAAEEDGFFGNSTGSVWLVDVQNGNSIAVLDPLDLAPEDGLGESVSIDGTIGVMSADAKDNDRGAAYVFDLTERSELRKLTASDSQAGDEFGQVVSISGDLVLVGAEAAENGAGAGYVFRASTGEELHRMTVNYEGFSELGNEAAIAGNHVLLGGDGPAVFLFDATTGELRKTIEVTEDINFGSSLAASGSWGLIGADEDNENKGAVHVIDLNTGDTVRKLVATDGLDGDEFGDTVAIHGTTALIAASDANDDVGAVYLFDVVTGLQIAKLEAEGIASGDGFGSALDLDDDVAIIGADGDTHVDGATSGLAYLFNVNLNELADANDDGTVNVADLDAISETVRAGTNDLAYDMNHDGAVNGDDRVLWVEALQHSYLGDSNLDGQFDSSDLVTVFSVGEYEDDVAGNSGWAEGDWDGNGDFDTSDLVAAFSSGGYDIGPRVAVAASAVPEPSGICLVLCGLTGFLRRKR